MAKLVYGLSQSLDGYVDHMKLGPPAPAAVRHFIELAQSLTEAGLIDEYQLYLRPVVLGGGTPFFAGPRPPLHLVASDLIADDLIRLTYVPA